MILKKLKISNFRQYYGHENEFVFSKDITLIIGDNSDGKTAMIQALKWLLDPESRPNIHDISAMRKKEMQPGDEDIMSIYLEFEHGGDKSLEKCFTFKKTDDNKIEISGFKFKGKETRGVQRITVDGKELVNRCFDYTLQEYSLFEGETALSNFNNPAKFKSYIENYSNLKDFDEYVKLTSSFEQKTHKQYTKASSNDASIAKQMSILEDQINDVKEDIHQIKLKIKENNRTVKFYEDKVNALNVSQDVLEENDRLIGIIRSKKQELRELKEKYNASLNTKLLDNYWVLCAFYDIYDEFSTFACKIKDMKEQEDNDYKIQQAKKSGQLEAVEKIKNMGKSSLPWYIPNQKAMLSMLHNHRCDVCGTPAPEGSAAYKFMENKLNEYLKQAGLDTNSLKNNKKSTEKKLFVNNYINQLYNLSIQLSGDKEKWLANIPKEIIDNQNKRLIQKDRIQNLERDIDGLEKERENLYIKNNITDGENLSADYSNLRVYYKKRDDAESSIRSCQSDLEEKSNRLKELQDQQAKLTPDKASVKILQRVDNVMRMINQAFEKARDNNKVHFLQTLQETANEHFALMNKNDFQGIIHFHPSSVDNALSIELRGSNGEKIEHLGGSQETTMYIAVLLAVSELTSSIQNNREYPIVFDAPTSNLGPGKTRDFFLGIKNLQKQFVILTKDLLIQTKGEEEPKLNEDIISQLDYKIYRIKKQEGYDQKDPSTLKTNIFTVKE